MKVTATVLGLAVLLSRGAMADNDGGAAADLIGVSVSKKTFDITAATGVGATGSESGLAHNWSGIKAMAAEHSDMTIFGTDVEA